MTEGERLSAVEYGVESVGLRGEPESGDLHLVKATSTGILIGVIDGAGHGVEAATAAQLAFRTIEAHAEDYIINIARACDEKLRRTRGAAMALVSINAEDDTITWLSIGNVEGILVRVDPAARPAYESIFMRPGIVGYSLPQLFASVFPLTERDWLILSTDGIRNDYPQRIAANVRRTESALRQMTGPQTTNPAQRTTTEEPTMAPHEVALKYDIDLNFPAGGNNTLSPRNLAGYICRNYVKGTDDALVLVAKYYGKT